MTGLQIIKLANRHVDDDIEYLDGIDWINECLMTLAEDAKLFAEYPFDIPDTNTYYDLPSDIIKIHEFEDDNGEVSYVDYIIRNGKIKVSAIGSYSIYYSKMPTEIAIADETDDVEIALALAEEIDCHKLLHKAVALFVASRYKSYDDEDNKDAQRLMSEFEQKKFQALKQINNLDNYNNVCIRVI